MSTYLAEKLNIYIQLCVENNFIWEVDIYEYIWNNKSATNNHFDEPGNYLEIKIMFARIFLSYKIRKKMVVVWNGST